MDDKVKKIMVVDDEDDLIFLLQILLDQMGFKVSGFTDPLLALRAFNAGTYDLAILDIKQLIAIAPTMMNTAMAADPFDGKGNPHDEPNFKDGNPHEGNQQGKPQRCPGSTC